MRKEKTGINKRDDTLNPSFTENSMVFVKQEMIDPSVLVDEVNLCRCCYKQMKLSDSQFVINDTLMAAFEEVTGLTIIPVHLATSFCESCYDSICSFQEFKQLATMRYQKFTELFLANNLMELNQIHIMNVNCNPLLIQPKVEEDSFSFVDYRETMNEKTTFNDESTHEDLWQPIKDQSPNESESNSYKNKPTGLKLKKQLKTEPKLSAAQSKICPICGKYLTNLEQHIKRVHGNISNLCDLCGYSATKRLTFLKHMRREHFPKSDRLTANGNPKELSDGKKKQKKMMKSF